jgi:2-polyprenyl-3-methyl-5-hydroxy-6-metoxy-1,4-benzoquinol methylase
MKHHWRFQKNTLEIESMPFYWRLSDNNKATNNISQRLPIRINIDNKNDYLKYHPTNDELKIINIAYKENENIGFLKPDSGQLDTYGSSVNNFFLKSVQQFKPKSIYEIGCGAGLSIKFLRKKGWAVTGIDPSSFSKKWSEKNSFKLINKFFNADDLIKEPDFIFCNDVFEHINDVENLSKNIFDALTDNGVFAICTTNSTQSIKFGDISMLEHQHVNMFSERSIYEILLGAGFREIIIKPGSYGNTFHILAIKNKKNKKISLPSRITDGYFERAKKCLESFSQIYKNNKNIHCYVPLRCIPYLSSVGDFETTPLYDSNIQWKNKYIDGYNRPILSLSDALSKKNEMMFIGSHTFFDEIKKNLIKIGWSKKNIFGISDLL